MLVVENEVEIRRVGRNEKEAPKTTIQIKFSVDVAVLVLVVIPVSAVVVVCPVPRIPLGRTLLVALPAVPPVSAWHSRTRHLHADVPRETFCVVAEKVPERGVCGEYLFGLSAVHGVLQYHCGQVFNPECGSEPPH